MSLKKSFILFSIILLIIPSLSIGILSYQFSKNELTKSGEMRLKNSVRFTIATIDELNYSVKKGKMSMEEAQEKIKIMMLGLKDKEGKRPVPDKFEIGTTGYLFAYDEKGNALAHPNLEGQNRWDAKSPDGVFVNQTIIKNGKNGGGFFVYDWAKADDTTKTEEKIVYSEMDPNWGWIISAGTNLKEFNSGADHILNVVLLILIPCLVLGVISSFIFSTRISNKILRNSKVAGESVENMSKAVKKINNQIDDITKNSNEMTKVTLETSSAIQEMVHSIEGVAKNADSSSSLVSETSAAIEQVTASISQVARSVEVLSQIANESSTTIEEMMASINEIADNTSHTSQLTNEAKEEATVGQKTVIESINGMKEIEKVIKESSEVMSNLGKRSETIGTIVEVIDGIAEQTNLLALNAAIEAARAGEHGKGFSVVAEEVKNLAERSANATKEIAELIKSIQEETTRAIKSIKNGEEKVTKGNELAQTVAQTIDKINEKINEVNKAMVSMTETTNEQNKASEQIIGSVENINDQVGKLKTATQEQNAGANDIIKSVLKMKEQVKEIALATKEQSKAGSLIIESVENLEAQVKGVNTGTQGQAKETQEVLETMNQVQNSVIQIQESIDKKSVEKQN